jgi:hypothetical protein
MVVNVENPKKGVNVENPKKGVGMVVIENY